MPKDQDLQILGAGVASAASKGTSEEPNDQSEEEQHPRILRMGWSAGESDFRCPTGRQPHTRLWIHVGGLGLRGRGDRPMFYRPRPGSQHA